jgi:hypothetical protein
MLPRLTEAKENVYIQCVYLYTLRYKYGYH